MVLFLLSQSQRLSSIYSLFRCVCPGVYLYSLIELTGAVWGRPKLPR